MSQQIVDSDKEELSSSLKTSYEEIHALVVKVNQYAGQIETLTKCLREEHAKQEKHEAFGKFYVLKEQFVVLKHEQGKCNQHLSSCLQKIESLCHVSHRLNRRFVTNVEVVYGSPHFPVHFSCSDDEADDFINGEDNII